MHFQWFSHLNDADADADPDPAGSMRDGWMLALCLRLRHFLNQPWTHYSA